MKVIIRINRLDVALAIIGKGPSTAESKELLETVTRLSENLKVHLVNKVIVGPEYKDSPLIMYFTLPDTVKVSTVIRTFLNCKAVEDAYFNIAENKCYKLNPFPKFPLDECQEGFHEGKLTDGNYYERKKDGFGNFCEFWRYWDPERKTTLGWQELRSFPNPVIIKIDLEEVVDICGASFNTAARPIDKRYWPNAIYILTSDDDKNWYFVGDLVELDSNPFAIKDDILIDLRTLDQEVDWKINLHNLFINNGSYNLSYCVHRYTTDAINTRGRFVAFIVQQGYPLKESRIYPGKSRYHFTYSDEIEIYSRREPPKLSPRAIPTLPPSDYYWWGPRLENYLKTIEGRLDKATHLSDDEREEAYEQINMLKNLLPRDIPATLPRYDFLTSIFRLNGIALKGQGLPPIFAWKTHRFDPLGPLEQPESPAEASININMMNNEIRSDAIILTNSTDKPIQVKLLVSGLQGGFNPDYLSIREVPFVDSAPRVDVAAALPEAERDGSDFVLTIPAGINRQLWVMASPKDLLPLSYKGKLMMKYEYQSRLSYIKVPLHLRISKIRFPDRPKLHLGGWDYTNEQEIFDVTPANRDKLITYLKSRYVDAPWATLKVLPTVANNYFDEKGNLIKELNFTNLDNWIQLWEDRARIFLIAINFGCNEFAGEEAGTEKFNKMVASWILVISEHIKTKFDIDSNQIGLLIFDEPNKWGGSSEILKWSKAIHQAGTEIQVWEDPIYNDPQSQLAKDVLKECDIICPKTGEYFEYHKKTGLKSYEDLIKGGRKLWFYEAEWFTRALDPYTYYRLQQWLCFREGAMGSCFWAFSVSGYGSSWNERASTLGFSCAPQYLSKDSVTDSKQMIGIVEGVQDYEYLSMLRERIEKLKTKGTPPKMSAEKFVQDLKDAEDLLKTAQDKVLAVFDSPVSNPELESAWGNAILWQTPKNRSVADEMCEKVIDMLERLDEY